MCMCTPEYMFDHRLYVLTALYMQPGWPSAAPERKRALAWPAADGFVADGSVADGFVAAVGAASAAAASPARSSKLPASNAAAASP